MGGFWSASARFDAFLQLIPRPAHSTSARSLIADLCRSHELSLLTSASLTRSVNYERSHADFTRAAPSAMQRRLTGDAGSAGRRNSRNNVRVRGFSRARMRGDPGLSSTFSALGAWFCRDLGGERGSPPSGLTLARRWAMLRRMSSALGHLAKPELLKPPRASLAGRP